MPARARALFMPIKPTAFFEANQAGEAIPDSEAQVSTHSRKNRKKSEQEIKPFVIARKNFLFCASMEGADALCLHFSFIRTAKLHGLDPYRYYVNVLKSIPHCKTAEDYEKLLPWNIPLD